MKGRKRIRKIGRLVKLGLGIVGNSGRWEVSIDIGGPQGLGIVNLTILVDASAQRSRFTFTLNQTSSALNLAGANHG